jgi:hypothetical protein
MIVPSSRFPDVEHIECELQENTFLRLVNANGRGIECLVGQALITAFNQPDDYVLRPGHVFIAPNNGLVLIEAVGSCRVRIDPPHSLYRRLKRILAACPVARADFPRIYGLREVKGR